MEITEEILDRACSVDTSISRDTIKEILKAANTGQVIFEDDAGETVENGKSIWPTYSQLIIDDPYRALEYSQQLLNGARTKLLEGKTKNAGILLMMAGLATLS